MRYFARRAALVQLNGVFESPRSKTEVDCAVPSPNVDKVRSSRRDPLAKLIRYAGVFISAEVVVAFMLFAGASAYLLIEEFCPKWLAVICGVICLVSPLLYLERLAYKRAAKFAEEFPAILLATASGLSAGHTALAALERSTRLLPEKSKIRFEVAQLLDLLRTGVPKEVAIRDFAADIQLEELDLFRSAFVLSLENGGRLAPSLQRLAQVLKDRSILITSARTATAVMRMTASFLLLLAPLIVSMVAFRTPDFFHKLFTHPVARDAGSLGILLIVGNCFLLRRMSDFRP